MVNTGVRQAREKGHAHEASIQGSGATAGATGDAPAGGTLPETIVSGIARLNGPSGCVKQAFRARVSGRSIASVGFYMDGKLLKNIAAQRAVYSAKIKPGRLGFGRHKIIARVTFVTGSATSGRTLAMTFRRCAKAAAAPTFTG